MTYYRKAYPPKEKPDHPGTYFAVWEVGDTIWHGATIWDGKRFKPEKIPELKGIEYPTYWLREMTGISATRTQRFTSQFDGETKEYQRHEEEL